MYYLIILFVVIYLIEDLEGVMMNKLKDNGNHIKNTPKYCGEFKCPDGGIPVCVRVTTNSIKNKGNNQIYIEMINKCEVEYMRCSKDYEATVVSMDYCMSSHLRYSSSDLLNDTVTGNNKDCSQLCNVEENLVCGRCNHNTFKTFPSTCHMRRFQCEYPTEKFELIARYPCVLSALFFNDAMNNNEKQLDSMKDDLVLKYIICKARQNIKGYNNGYTYNDLYCIDIDEKLNDELSNNL